MKFFRSFLTMLAASLIVASVAAAQQSEQFVIASSSSSGTYDKMLAELIGVCSTDNFNIVKATGVAGGAPGNLDALVNNGRINAAFLHSDVYFANAMADPSYAKYQTLIALYPEPIHVLALRQSKTSKQGMSFGKQEFNTLSDARGFKVGAAGGGVFTAKILQGQGDGGFTTIAYENGDQVIAALNNGDISLAVFVGAAPLPNLEKLNKLQYKLIPVGEAIAGRVSTVYRPATINYNGFTTGPIKTIAPVALLMTKKYNTPKLVAIQRHLRDCFNSHLGELKDTGAPNWQAVEANDHGLPNIQYYDIPETSGAASTRKKP